MYIVTKCKICSFTGAILIEGKVPLVVGYCTVGIKHLSNFKNICQGQAPNHCFPLGGSLRAELRVGDTRVPWGFHGASRKKCQLGRI